MSSDVVRGLLAGWSSTRREDARFDRVPKGVGGLVRFEESVAGFFSSFDILALMISFSPSSNLTSSFGTTHFSVSVSFSALFLPAVFCLSPFLKFADLLLFLGTTAELEGAGRAEKVSTEGRLCSFWVDCVMLVADKIVDCVADSYFRVSFERHSLEVNSSIASTAEPLVD